MIKTLTLAMTGASGAPYTLRLMQCCLEAGIHVQFLCSQAGQIVLGMESDLKLMSKDQFLYRNGYNTLNYFE